MSRGHVRQRGPGSWEAVVSAGTDPITGRRVQLRRSARDEASAQRALTDLQRQADTGSYVDSTKLSLGRYVLDQWLPYIETEVRPRTAARYRSLMVGHVIPPLGSVKMAKLRPAHVQAMLVEIQKTVGAHTTGHAYRVLHMALGYAVRVQLLNSNPAAAVRPPRHDRPQLTVPSSEDVSRLIDAADGWVRTAVILAASTGMRRGEVLALQWKAVDLDRGTAEVNLALENVGQRLELTLPKTPRSRRKVSLAPSTVTFLRSVRKDQNERRLLLGGEWQATDLVVERGDGAPIHPDLLSQAFRRLAKRTGLVGVRLHDLRHAYASALLRANVHPKVVSDQLGHSSVAFTMDVYSHLMPSAGQSAAAAIEASLTFSERG